MGALDVLETILPLCLARIVFNFAKEDPRPFRAPMFCNFSLEDRQVGFGDYEEDLFTLPGLAMNF